MSGQRTGGSTTSGGRELQHETESTLHGEVATWWRYLGKQVARQLMRGPARKHGSDKLMRRCFVVTAAGWRHPTLWYGAPFAGGTVVLRVAAHRRRSAGLLCTEW